MCFYCAFQANFTKKKKKSFIVHTLVLGSQWGVLSGFNTNMLLCCPWEFGAFLSYFYCLRSSPSMSGYKGKSFTSPEHSLLAEPPSSRSLRTRSASFLGKGSQAPGVGLGSEVYERCKLGWWGRYRCDPARVGIGPLPAVSGESRPADEIASVDGVSSAAV